jgi:phage repressor protein C with HTH and peptisase S24 domain
VLGELVNWAMQRRRLFRVRGVSMVPLLHDGEYVLIDPQAAARVGAIVVSRHPFKNVDVVKRVEAIDEGLVTLWSPQGTHSRHFGRVPTSSIHGRVTASLSRRRRIDQAEMSASASSGST